MSQTENSTNTKEESTFFAAVKAGNHPRVADLLGRDSDLVHACDQSEFGGTAINLAVSRSDREMVDLLLDQGADLAAKSDFGPGPWPAVQLALSAGNDDLAEYLVARGAPVGVHEAAGLGLCRELKSMLSSDAGLVNERGGDGCMPLHFAKTPEVADLLLEYGAELEARCIDHHSTPTDYLCTSRPATAIHLMDRGANYHLFTTIAAGDEIRFRKMLNDPEAVDLRIDENNFPKHPDTGAMNIMYFSLGSNSSPLHAAARVNRPGFIKQLLKAGMNINTRADYDDCTALHVSAWWDRVEVARCLIEAGADVEANSGEIHRNSPAGWAVVAGSCHVLELLLVEHQAEVRDYYIRDAELAAKGEFRIYKAVSQGNYEKSLRLLRSREIKRFNSIKSPIQ